MMWILWLYLINTPLMFIIAVCEARRPARALNLLAICLVLPVIGFLFYLTITKPKLITRDRQTSPHNDSDALPDSFSRTASVIAHSLRHLSVSGIRTGKVRMLTNGIETFDALIESIKNARKSIDLEFYIYRDDRIGNLITDVCIEKARDGVKVRFMKDAVGSSTFPQAQIARMKNAGIQCRTVFPLHFPWILSNWYYRDHCKIAVIDCVEAFTGGINIGYEYTGLKPDVGFWRDTHMRIQGEAAADLLAVFNEHWSIATPERIKRRAGAVEPVEEPNTGVVPRAASAGMSVEWAEEPGTQADGSEAGGAHANNEAQRDRDAYLQMFEGNPGIPTQVIRELFFVCLTQAVKTLDIATPYFLPDADIIMALKTAVARGVRVRLLVPYRSNHQVVDLASRTYYGELLEAGVHIYGYTKGLLHAKVMIVDEEIAEVGAANYDMRSFRLNYEVCGLIYSTGIAKELTDQFERDLLDSVPLRIEDLLRRPLSQRIIQQGARLLAPML